MGVAAEEERAGDALRLAVLDDSLRRRKNVVFIEGRGERRAPVTARAEDHAVRGILRIWMTVVIRVDQSIHIDEVALFRGKAGSIVHDNILPPRAPVSWTPLK